MAKKMNVKNIVKKLENEIKGEGKKDVVNTCEELLSEEIEELSKYKNFFNLPLKNIFSVISKVNFNEIEENDKTIEIIQNIIINTINKHFEEKETILILQNLNIKTLSFSYEEIFSILELIRNCPILVNFCHLYKEQNILPDKDYEYQIQQKDKEIEKLRQANIHYLSDQSKEIIIKKQISKVFPSITEKPIDYEPNIFKACKVGKITSVQWLIEIEKEDKNKKEEKDNYELQFYQGYTPIHIASENGHLSIVEYLIEKQNIDKDIKGRYGKTPLHYACLNGHLPIVKYLISKGSNVEAIDSHKKTPLHYACEEGHLPIVQYLVSKDVNIEAKDDEEKTPLHYACEFCHLPVIEYLISKRENIEPKDKDDWTLLHWASYYGETDLVKYLVSRGENKNAKTKDGKTPYDLASSDEIRNILK